MDLERERCADHTQKVCELYCTDCDKTVCVICLATKHRQHAAVHIKQIVETEKRNISKKLVSLEDSLSKLKTSLSRRSSHHENYRQSIDNSKVQLAQQIQQAKSEMDDIHEELSTDLSQSMERENQQYSTDKENIENEISKLEKLIKSTKTNLTKETITELVPFSKDLQKTIKEQEQYSFYDGHSKTPLFVQGNIQRSAYTKSIGHVDHPASSNANHNTGADKSVRHISSVTISASFKSQSNSPVRGICPVNHEQAWIIQNHEKTLTLQNKNGYISKTIPLEFYPDDMALADTGALLLTTFDGCVVHKVSQDGSVSKMADFSPDCTRGICMTKNQDVLVCIISQDADRNSQIVRLSSTGRILQKIEHMNTASPMFYWPSRVGCQVTGEIVILDWELGNNKSVILDGEGNYVSTWRGEIGNRVPRKFSPCGIACYQGGLNFITDRKNDQVYQLREGGKTADILLKSPHKIKDPFGIAVDVDGSLWVGCGDGSVHVLTLNTSKSNIDVTHF